MTRPIQAQIKVILEFMEKHPELARGTLRSLEGRHQARKLWRQLTTNLNSIPDGARKNVNTWMKYWSDKKSNVKKTALSLGNPELESTDKLTPTDKKILSLVGMRSDPRRFSAYGRKPLKTEDDDTSEMPDDRRSIEYNDVDTEFVGQRASIQDRELALMEKLVQVMGDQATALAQLAQSSLTQAQAMDRLADSSQVQANALQQVANSFDRMSCSFGGSGTALSRMDVSIQKYTNAVGMIGLNSQQ